jgi:hypothetical protein
MNYRSAIVFGTAKVVESEDEKLRVLQGLTEHLVNGRWEDIRKPTTPELRATLVFSLSIEEASAKVRTGPPIDDDDDYALPVWAGVLPLKLMAADPVPDPRLPADVALPPHVTSYHGPGPACS